MDGFITAAEREDLISLGAAGEIVGWVFDVKGRILDCPLNERVASAPIPSIDRCEVIALAMGQAKTTAIRAAAAGGIVSGLITDEATAARLLRG